MLTGLVIGVVVAIVGVISMTMRQNKERSAMIVDLAHRGINKVMGPGALAIPPSRFVIGAHKPMTWSAAVPGNPTMFLYQMGGNGIFVAAWQSRLGRPGSFVLSSRAGVNPDKRVLQEVPKKELPASGMRLFTSGPEVTQWVLASQAMQTYAYRFGNQGLWNFSSVDGYCYLYSYQASWKGLDDMLQTASAFEASLVVATA